MDEQTEYLLKLILLAIGGVAVLCSFVTENNLCKAFEFVACLAFGIGYIL